SIVWGAGLLADADAWAKLRRRVGDAIDAQHSGHPESGGLSIAEIPPIVTAVLPRHAAALAPAVAEALVAALCERDFARTQAVIRRTSHRMRLPPRLEPAARQLRRRLEERPFDPPSRKDLCGGGDVDQQALRFMIANGDAIDVAAEVVLSAPAYQRAVAM